MSRTWLPPQRECDSVRSGAAGHFSKSTASELSKELQRRVDAWNERPLEGQKNPFLIVDAVVIKVRKEEKVRSVSALIVSGINTEGYREILGMRLGNSETEATWREIFGWLKDRGLQGVDDVVSDAHPGLVAAVQRCFQGAQCLRMLWWFWGYRRSTDGG